MIKVLLYIASLALLIIFRHTNVFIKYWDDNTNFSFFDNRTFGYMIYYDPCENYDSAKLRNKFRNYINKNMKCIGKRCEKTGFTCLDSKVNCYHVEHIIDENGPEYENKDKNIMANLVMSWGTWNVALGGLARNDYNSSIHEKKIVYGEHVINKVRSIIEQCKKMIII